MQSEATQLIAWHYPHDQAEHRDPCMAVQLRPGDLYVHVSNVKLREAMHVVHPGYVEAMHNQVVENFMDQVQKAGARLAVKDHPPDDDDPGTANRPNLGATPWCNNLEAATHKTLFPAEHGSMAADEEPKWPLIQITKQQALVLYVRPCLKHRAHEAEACVCTCSS